MTYVMEGNIESFSLLMWLSLSLGDTRVGVLLLGAPWGFIGDIAKGNLIT